MNYSKNSANEKNLCNNKYLHGSKTIFKIALYDNRKKKQTHISCDCSLQSKSFAKTVLSFTNVEMPDKTVTVRITNGAS
jgi:hypothetical protein